MNQLDLFAGIGGITLAAEWAGINTVAFCEKEPFAQSILRKRFPGRPIYSDIFDLTKEVLEHDGITGIDIVAGGFPCQPFSNAGKRTGTSDDRYLWPEMCRLVGELRPSWVFAENVDGLVSMAQSGGGVILEDETTICNEAEMVIETIRKDLEAIGYQSVPVVIPASAIGASHRRYRIFILGYTDSIGDNSKRESGSNGSRQADFEKRSKSQCGSSNSSENVDDTKCSRCSRDSRGRPESELENGHSGSEAGIMADSSSARLEEQPKSNGTEHSTEDRTRENNRSERCSQDVAHTKCFRQSGQGQSIKSSYSAQDRDGQTGGAFDVRIESERTTEPRLGGNPYEFSDWLDGWGMNPLDALINFIASYPQPALMGQEQHEWEPPRVATGVKNRAARLKALGNAVDPLQALPVLYGIRVLHEQMRGELA